MRTKCPIRKPKPEVNMSVQFHTIPLKLRTFIIIRSKIRAHETDTSMSNSDPHQTFPHWCCTSIQMCQVNLNLSSTSQTSGSKGTKVSRSYESWKQMEHITKI